MSVISSAFDTITVNLNKADIPNNANVYGTEELDDFVDLIYSAFEAYEKAKEDGVINVSDIILLGNVVMNLFSAINGANTALAEAFNLTDAEITSLVNLAEEYELGNSLTKYKQLVKELLLKLQTISVFIN